MLHVNCFKPVEKFSVTQTAQRKPHRDESVKTSHPASAITHHAINDAWFLTP